MRQLFALVMLVSVVPCHAAFERTHQGGSGMGMGGSHVAARGYEWSVFVNPAVLATVQTRTLALFYAPRIFGISELTDAAATYIEPTSLGTFAISASRFGFDLYRESQFAVSCGETIAGPVFVGVTLHYYSLSIRNYGSAGAVGVDVGLLADITEEVQWGFSASNISATRIGNAREKLPQVFTTGIAYSPFREALLAASLRKDIRHPVEVQIGLEYRLLGMIALRAGTSTDPSIVHTGIGVHYSMFRLDYGLAAHAELGLTHQFSLALDLGDF